MPFWRPDPLTSEIDRDGNPSSSSSMRIGSNASWRVKASIFFMASGPRRLGAHRADARRLRARWGQRRPGHPRLVEPAGELRLRDELLRVAVHAVLGDVQTGLLGLPV